jgi:hypothetical protein
MVGKLRTSYSLMSIVLRTGLGGCRWRNFGGRARY